MLAQLLPDAGLAAGPVTATLVACLAGIVLFSAAVQGFLGFAFAVVGMPLTLYLIGARDANLLFTPLSLLLAAGMTYRTRAHARWKLALLLTGGALVGSPLGVWVLARADESVMCRLLGIVILASATFLLLNPTFRKHDMPALWALPAGLVGGFFAGATSTGGPTAVIYLLLLGLPKDELKATLVAHFLLLGAYKLGVLVAWGGLLRPTHVCLAAVLAVPLFVGMTVGMRAARSFSPKAMRKVICVFLLVPGVLLLVR
jgi:uncharacterized membrane protein YfcA